jgi:hypothetical protein
MPPKRVAPPRPDAFKQATVYIECAAFKEKQYQAQTWNARLDHAELKAGAYDLSGTNLKTWSDATGKYWAGDALKIVFKGTAHIRGKLLVRFRDPDSQGARTAEGTFDGNRRFVIPSHGVTEANPEGAYWLTLPVDMEDFLDGELVLQIRKKSGTNVMIDRVILMPNAE